MKRGSISFLGVGHLAQFIIAGLFNKNFNTAINLYGRNRDLVATLSSNYGCRQLENKQKITESKYIALCVRPQQLQSALTDIEFCAEHILISFVAGINSATINSYCNGNPTIVRVMPNSAAEVSASCNLMFPDNSDVRSVFANIGNFIAAQTELEFEKASVVACLYASILKLQSNLIDELVNSGVSDTVAKQTITETFKGSAELAMQSQLPTIDLVNKIAWQGTFSQKLLSNIDKNNGFRAWENAVNYGFSKLIK